MKQLKVVYNVEDTNKLLKTLPGAKFAGIARGRWDMIILIEYDA